MRLTVNTFMSLLFLNQLSTDWDDCSSGAAGEPASLQEVIWSPQRANGTPPRQNDRMRRRRARQKPFQSTDKTKVSFHKAFAAFTRTVALHDYEDDTYLKACDIESYFWYRCK